MPMKSSFITSGTTLAFAAFSSFAISDAFSKLLAGALDPFEVAFSGGVFGLLIIPFIRKPGESLLDLLPRRDPFMWFVRALCTFVATAASVEAFMLLPMTEALTLLFLMPLLVTVLSVIFLKEKVTGWAWLAVALGFVGVLVVMRPGMRALNFGHLCALMAALACSISVIACRVGGGTTSRLSMFGSSLAGPLIGDGALMLPHMQWPHDAMCWINLFGYGFLAALGQLLMMIATARAPANKVALPQYSQMIWAVGFSYVLFNNPLDAWTAVGIVIVTFSGMLNWIRQRIRYRQAARREHSRSCAPKPHILQASST